MSSKNKTTTEVRRINRLWLISPLSALMAIALWQVNLGIVFFTKDTFNTSPATIGLLLAISSSTYGTGCLLVVPWFAHIKPATVLIIATLGLSITSFSMQCMPAVGYLFILYALYGVFASLFWPPIMGWLSAGIEGAELNRALAIFNMSFSTGNVISPYICGRLSEVGTRIPLFVGGSVFMIMALSIYLFMKFFPVKQELPRSEARNCGDSGKTDATTSAIRYIAWCGLFATFFGLGALNAVFPLAGQEKLHLSKSIIGSSFLVRSLTMGISFAWLGMTSFWHYRFMPLCITQLIGAIAYIGFIWSRTAYPVISCMGVIGCITAMSYSASIYHGASGSNNRTRRMAIHESIIAISGVAGSSIGGIIYQKMSAQTVYCLCALMLLIVTGVQVAIVKWKKNGLQLQQTDNTVI